MSRDGAILKEVCKITMGQAPPGDTYNTDGEGVPLIAGAGDFGEIRPEASKFTTSPTKLSRPGDIILCIRATIGDRNWSDTEYCLGRGVAGLSGREEKLDQKYLWHWLGQAAPVLKAKGRGATFLQVNKADIGSLEIPLPSLADQHRIAAILDKADALRAKRSEAIDKLDQLLQSIFIDMFGDPIANPMNWPTGCLKDLGKVQTGSTPPSSATGMFHGEIMFVTPGDLGGVVRASRRTVTDKGASAIRIADAGSTLVCCIGATIGKMGFTTDVATFNQQINAITWKQAVQPNYAYRAMTFFAKEIASRGASTTLPILKKSEFEKLQIPVPPKELQSKFARLEAAIGTDRDMMERASVDSDSLFFSIRQRAFSGEL